MFCAKTNYSVCCRECIDPKLIDAGDLNIKTSVLLLLSCTKILLASINLVVAAPPDPLLPPDI